MISFLLLCWCNNISFYFIWQDNITNNYNIARALVLSKPYWAIMNEIFIYARPCSIKWRVQFHFSCKISVPFSASPFCLSFGNVKIILNNPNPTSSLWVLPGKDLYFNVSILTLFVSIFIEYSNFVWLRFHHNLAQFEEANFSLTILETRLSVFVQLLLNWLCCVRIIKTSAVSFTVHREN